MAKPMKPNPFTAGPSAPPFPPKAGAKAKVVGGKKKTAKKKTARK